MNLPNTREALVEAVTSGRTFTYVYFWGHRKPASGTLTKSCFSQWYEQPFRVGEEVFRTAEHYMMVHKARLFGDLDSARAILSARTPNDAKSLGRKVRGFSELIWLLHREHIVFAGNLEKFRQNAALRDFILSTGDSILVEASPVDSIWGIGLSQEDPRADDVREWMGLNLLGFALTKVREYLRAQIRGV